MTTLLDRGTEEPGLADQELDQLDVLGVMGEYLGRLYSQSKHRPLYIVSDIRGSRAERPARLGINASAERPVTVHQESRERGHDDVGHDGPPGRLVPLGLFRDPRRRVDPVIPGLVADHDAGLAVVHP